MRGPVRFLVGTSVMALIGCVVVTGVRPLGIPSLVFQPGHVSERAALEIEQKLWKEPDAQIHVWMTKLSGLRPAGWKVLVRLSVQEVNEASSVPQAAREALRAILRDLERASPEAALPHLAHLARLLSDISSTVESPSGRRFVGDFVRSILRRHFSNPVDDDHDGLSLQIIADCAATFRNLRLPESSSSTQDVDSISHGAYERSAFEFSEAPATRLARAHRQGLEQQAQEASLPTDVASSAGERRESNEPASLGGTSGLLDATPLPIVPREVRSPPALPRGRSGDDRVRREPRSERPDPAPVYVAEEEGDRLAPGDSEQSVEPLMVRSQQPFPTTFELLEASEQRELDDWSLMLRLNADDAGVAIAAAEELKRRGFSSRHVLLAETMTLADARQRAALAGELISMPALDPRPWLLQLSRDPDATVRRAAVAVMATTNDPAIHQRLRQMQLSETDPRTRRTLSRLTTERR